MKKFFKRAATAVIALTMVFGVAGCTQGEKSTGGSSNKNGTEYVYVPEYKNIDTDKDYLQGLRIVGEYLYYVSGKETEENPVYAFEKYALATGEVTSIPIELGENTGVSNVCVDNEGNAVLILAEYGEDKTKYGAMTVSAQGEISAVTDITESLKESQYIAYCVKDKEGNLYLYDGTAINVLNENFGSVKRIETSDYIYAMGVSHEGKVIVSCYGATGIAAKEIDITTGGFGKVYEGFPDAAYGLSISDGGENKVLVNGEMGLYVYDTQTQTKEELVNWIDCDVDSGAVESFAMNEDGTVTVVTSSWDGEESAYELVTLKKTDSSQVTAKTEIVLGTIYLSQDTRKAVIDFNKNNSQYRITVKDYYTDAGDYEAAITQFNNDMGTGNAPDIIDTSVISYDTYATKGAFEDLYPYIEKDEDMNLEDYFENVLKVYERDGKLYTMIPTFVMTGCMGKAEDFEGVDALTIEAIQEAARKKAPDTQIMPGATKDVMLYYMVAFDLGSYIDYTTGECYFDTEEFKKVLEFSNVFPEEYDYENSPGEAQMIADGKVLLSAASVSSVEDMQYYRAVYGEDTEIRFFSFPSGNGNTGLLVQSSCATLAISSKSDNKEGAWEFIKYFVSDEYQNSANSWAFPVSKKAFEKKMEEAMTPEYDEDGNEISMSSVGVDNLVVDLYAATQEDVDYVYSIIDRVSQAFVYDEQIYNILTEEAGSYFAGQKSVDEVASVIQSRVKIYINESK